MGYSFRGFVCVFRGFCEKLWYPFYLADPADHTEEYAEPPESGSDFPFRAKEYETFTVVTLRLSVREEIPDPPVHSKFDLKMPHNLRDIFR